MLGSFCNLKCILNLAFSYKKSAFKSPYLSHWLDSILVQIVQFFTPSLCDVEKFGKNVELTNFPRPWAHLQI